MIITRSDFNNYIRCISYYALSNGYKLLSKSKTDVKNAPLYREQKSKIAELYGNQHLFKNNTIEITEKYDCYFQKYQTILEDSFVKASKGFIDNGIIASLDLAKQKVTSTKFNEYEFIAYNSGYFETENSIYIIDFKYTSSKRYLDLFFRDEQKNIIPLFEEYQNNRYRLKGDSNHLEKKYYRKEHFFFDRHNDIGNHTYDLTYQRFIIERNNIKSKEVFCYLAFINNDYIFNGNLDNEGFPIYDENIISFFDLSRITKEMMPIITRDFHSVIDYMNKPDGDIRHIRIGQYCERNKATQCMLFDYCAHRVKGIPYHDSIFTYIDNHRGFDNDHKDRYDLINASYTKATDIPRNWLTRKSNVIQRFVIETKEEFIDYAKISLGLSLLRRPYLFLVIRSYLFPLPKMGGQIPFSSFTYGYSIHRLDGETSDFQNDSISYIANFSSDEEIEMLQNLIEDLSDEQATIIVYGKNNEIRRLRELQNKYPVYQEKIDIIISRIFDFQALLRGKKSELSDFDGNIISSDINYYHDKMNGSFSFDMARKSLLSKDEEESNVLDILNEYYHQSCGLPMPLNYRISISNYLKHLSYDLYLMFSRIKDKIAF